MEITEITNVEQARKFYIEDIHDCPRPAEDIDNESMNAYKRHSSRSLERIWAFEEFTRLFSLIEPQNPDNLKLLKDAWNWYEDSFPVKLVAEKLEIMMSGSNGKPDKMLIDCLHTTAKYSEIDKDDNYDEQTLFRLMKLAEPYLSEEENEVLRFKIAGPDTEDEAKRFYRSMRFHDNSDNFQTDAAEEKFKQFASPENTLKWKQEYFNEWTDKAYFLSKESMYPVSPVELVGLYFGIYGRENLRKLYDKLTDYKNCLAVDQYWHTAFEITSHLSKRLFDDGEYDLLESFYRLALDMLDDAPDCWDKEYFGNLTIDRIEEYTARIKKAREEELHPGII